MIDAVGWLAVILTQIFWVPNIARILRTKQVDGYSLVAWVLMTLGLACYLLYFASRGDPVGIVANVSGVLGAGITTVCILKWRGRAEPRAVPSEHEVLHEHLGESPI